MMTEKIYENTIHSRNPIYNRQEIIKSISMATRLIANICSTMSDEEKRQYLYKYIACTKSKIIFENDTALLIETNGQKYCFLMSSEEEKTICQNVNSKDVTEYFIVRSVSKFIEKHMKKVLFSFLLRDYDVLNFVPEEFQSVQKALS